MPGRASWVRLSELDLPWPADWARGSNVAADQPSVQVIVGTWEEWAATLLSEEVLLQANTLTIALCQVAPGFPGKALPASLEGCDLRIRIGAPATPNSGSACRHWNHVCVTDKQAQAWVDTMTTRIHDHGIAAISCARTLRMTARMPELQGIVLESVTYSMLQAGSAHRQWLSGRSS